jgi:hypothetical protein
LLSPENTRVFLRANNRSFLSVSTITLAYDNQWLYPENARVFLRANNILFLRGRIIDLAHD